MDPEPKAQIAGDETWGNFDVTPLVECYSNRWIDLVGEVTVGYTEQTGDLHTVELTSRIGIRLHILSNLRERLEAKHQRLGRIAIANLLRLASRCSSKRF